MTFGLYLLFTCFLLIGFGLWIRGLVVRRLRPERILADLTQEVQSLVAGINQAGDTNISLLEDRISRLTELVQLADRQIDDARVAVERLSEHRTISLQEARAYPDQPTAAHPAAAEDSLGKSPTSISDDATAVSNETTSETVESTEEKSEPDHPTGEEQRSHVQEDRERVISLYRQGLSEDLIASRTGIAVGEVNLIIALQGKRPWQ